MDTKSAMVKRPFEDLGPIRGQSRCQRTCGAAHSLGKLGQIGGRPVYRRYRANPVAVGPGFENRCTRVTKGNDLIQQDRQHLSRALNLQQSKRRFPVLRRITPPARRLELHFCGSHPLSQ